MKIRTVICSTGPRSQLTYIIPFIASSPEALKHTSPPAAVQGFYRGRPIRPLSTVYIAICRLFPGTMASGRYHRQPIPFVLFEYLGCRPGESSLELDNTFPPTPLR